MSSKITEFFCLIFLIILIIIITLFLSGNLLYQSQSEQDFFFTILERFAENHEYINGTYNCQNYSKDFAVVAKNLGYEVYVYENYNQTHSYNLLAIEPQTGMIKHIS